MLLWRAVAKWLKQGGVYLPTKVKNLQTKYLSTGGGQIWLDDQVKIADKILHFEDKMSNLPQSSPA
jgi:hypothetical protein